VTAVSVRDDMTCPFAALEPVQGLELVGPFSLLAGEASSQQGFPRC
jgi:hypothetical protein